MCLGAGVWRGAFFFAGLRMLLGTPELSFESCVASDFDLEAGSCRRELKEDMNSIDCGVSPRRLLK